MKQIILSDEQLKFLFVCVDTYLKTNGLVGLNSVVDLVNALQATPQQG